MEKAVADNFKERLDIIAVVAGNTIYGEPSQHSSWDWNRIACFFMGMGAFGNGPQITDEKHFDEVRTAFINSFADLVTIVDLINWESSNFNRGLAKLRMEELAKLPQHGTDFYWEEETVDKIEAIRRSLLHAMNNGLMTRTPHPHGGMVALETRQSILTPDEGDLIQKALRKKDGTRSLVKKALKLGLNILKETGYKHVRFNHPQYTFDEAQGWLRYEKQFQPLIQNVHAQRIAIKILIRRDLEASHLWTGAISSSDPVMYADEGVTLNPLLLGIKEEAELKKDLLALIPQP